MAATSILIFLSGERAAIILMILLTLYFIVMVKELKLLELYFLISIFSISGLFLLNENVQSRYVHKELKSDYWVNNEILDKEYTIGIIILFHHI